MSKHQFLLKKKNDQNVCRNNFTGSTSLCFKEPIISQKITALYKSTFTVQQESAEKK